MANPHIDFLLALVALPIVILITLFLTALSLIFLPYRLTVQLIARLFRPEMTSIEWESQNAIYAANTGPYPTANIVSTLVVDGKVSVDVIRERFRTRILTEVAEDGTLVYQKFKHMLTSFMGYRFYQTDDHFDLSHHIRVYDPTNDLKPISTGPCVTEEDYKIILPKLGSRPWDDGRGQWEILIIENFKSGKSEEEKTLLALRMNHADGDGYAVDQIFAKLSDNPPTRNQLSSAAVQTSSLSLGLVRRIILVFQSIWDSSWMLTMVKYIRGPWVVTRAEKTGSWHFDCTQPMPMSKIKSIKNKLGVSYNAVFLTALARALRRMCAHGRVDLPQVILCGFPLAKPHHPGSLTNHHYSVPLALPLPDATTIPALRAVDTDFKRIASSTAPQMLDFWLGLSRFIPSGLTSIMMFPIAPSMSIGICPSLTGPNYYSGYLASGIISSVIPLAAPANNGATVSITGINGHQRLNLLMDEAAFPHPEAFRSFVTYLEEEIEILEQFCR